MNYYKRHVKDYIAKTAHLSLLEHGVYTRILDIYYEREQPLTRSEAVRFLRVSTEAEISALDAVLADFFDLDGDAYVQSRVEQEFADAAQVAATNKENGKKGGRPRKAKGKRTETHSVSGANRTESENKGNPLIHESTNPLEQKTAPKGDLLDGISPEVAADFKALRSKLRAPITATAMNGIRREAALAGLDLEAALVVCCERGWRGFKAEWLREARAGPPPNQPFGKTAQAISQLQAMKNELAENRTADRIPEAALLGPGPDPRR